MHQARLCRPALKWLLALATIVVGLNGSPPIAPASVQAQAGATLRSEAWFDLDNPPGRLWLVQSVVDLAPGAALPWSDLTGHGFATVIEGAVTVRVAALERSYPAGESFVEEPSEPLTISNFTPTPARLLTALLLTDAAGPNPVAVAPNPAETLPGVTALARASFELLDQPADLTVVLRVADFEPHTLVPAHLHPGQSYVTLLSGEAMLCVGGVEQHFTTGETWVEPALTPHSGLTGDLPVRIAATTMVPKGQRLTLASPSCSGLSPAGESPPTTAPAAR